MLFISYSRQNEAVAATLVSDFEALGHVVWLDRELSGGQAWWDQILAKIRECDAFVFLLAPKSVSSTACQREFAYANELGKPVLPVLVCDGVSMNLLPPELARLQHLDYRNQDRDAAFRLARALGSLPAPKPLPNPLPSPPDVPISYLSGLAKKVDSVSSLSYDEQAALIVDLRRGVRDVETAADARPLVERLRKRRDLFAPVAEELDELLAPALPVRTVPSNLELPAQPDKVPTFRLEQPRSYSLREVALQRLSTALIAGIFGGGLQGFIAVQSMLLRARERGPSGDDIGALSPLVLLLGQLAARSLAPT